MDLSSISPCETLAERYQALLKVAQAVSARRDLDELFHDLAHRLPRVVQVNYVDLSLHDPVKKTMRRYTIQVNAPADLVRRDEVSVEDCPAGLVWQGQSPLIVPNLSEERRWQKVIGQMVEDSTQSFCFVPLTTARGRLGAMGFMSQQKKVYSSTDIEFLQQVARQVAVAVENTLNFQRAHQAEEEMRRQLERERLMLEINNAVVSHLSLRDLLKAISLSLRRVIPHDASLLTLHEPGGNQLRLHALDLHMFGTVPFEEGVLISLHDTPEGQAIVSRQPVLVGPMVDLTRFSSPWVKHAVENGVKSGCSVPLITHDRAVGALSVVSAQENAFTEADAWLLSQCAKQIAIAVENVLAYQEIENLKDKLNKEKLYLEDEIRSELNFEEIIGESPAIKKVLKQVDIVAPTDSTVLILGETGTGKELLARAIHDRSKRRERTFVKLNCAAIPTGLLESELFGHERGAFTGAIATKVGRFELADGGTLFLDEVGDIPLELQSKLLRVLQEQEFERLGSTRTIKVSVRLLAATNRDLLEMVEEKQFRGDLYYRLNVFPLTVPALRDRREDIPLLVRYFVQQLARRMDKTIDTIPTASITALSRYDWPGNIRELENLIERAVILTQSTALYVPLSELKPRVGDGIPSSATLEETERQHILRILKAAKWVIGGPTGAAAQLGMKRTTLQSKMQRLGIARPI